ncbi:MAG: hypothetical protein PHC95_08395 [Parabacteroides sp.]|nr:hypothetical protein [Parabacteroides sp.]
MAKRYLINLFLLIALLCGFSSCEEDPYYDPYEEITYDLCYYVWTDGFIVDGVECEQQLTFNPDGRGWDYRTYYSYGSEIDYEEIPFVWEWDSYYTDKLYMDYEDGETVLERIQIVGRTLDCVYNGERVTFKAN